MKETEFERHIRLMECAAIAKAHRPKNVKRGNSSRRINHYISRNTNGKRLRVVGVIG